MSLEKQVEALVKEIKLDREDRSRMDRAASSKRDTKSSSVGSSVSRTAQNLKTEADSFSSLLRTSLTDFYEDQTKKYGGTIDYITGEYENFVSYTVKEQGRIISDMADKAGQIVGGRTIIGAFGSAAQLRKELEAIYDENTYYINRIAEDYNGEFGRTKEMGTKMMADSLTIQRSLKINSADFQQIIANEMASTKVVTMDVFKEIAFFADAYSKQTAANLYQLTNNIARARANFDLFGAASTENIALLGASLSQLQLGTSDVENLISSIQTFEGATRMAQELGGAFGAILDPLALMETAFNDPAQAIEMVRQAMIDAGADSESLGHAVTMVAKSMNLSTETARKLLDANVDVASVLSNAVSSTEYSIEGVDAAVARAQKSIVDHYSASDIITNRLQERYELAADSTMRKFIGLEQRFKELLRNNQGMLGGFFEGEELESFAGFFEKYAVGTPEERKKAKEEMDTMFENIANSDKFEKATKEKYAQLQKELTDLEGDSLNDVLNRFNESDREIKVSISDVDVEGINNSLEEASNLEGFKSIEKSFENSFAFTRRRSASPLEEQSNKSLLNFAKSVGRSEANDGFAQVKKSMENAFSVEVNPQFKDLTMEKIFKGEKIDTEVVVKTKDQILNENIVKNNLLLEKIHAKLSEEKEVHVNNTIKGDLMLGNKAIAALNDIIIDVVDSEFTKRGA